MPKTPRYRWIVYLYGGHPSWGFEVERFTSLKQASERFFRYAIVPGYDRASACLYPYSEDDWQEARECASLGCPFDYPSKIMELGPRQGVKVENA